MRGIRAPVPRSYTCRVDLQDTGLEFIALAAAAIYGVYSVATLLAEKIRFRRERGQELEAAWREAALQLGLAYQRGKPHGTISGKVDGFLVRIEIDPAGATRASVNFSDSFPPGISLSELAATPGRAR